MSSLKLKHSGGNSVIIAGPSSNPAADRTINLNDNYAGDGSFVTANSSGNVGIGTASPSNALDVQGGATNTAIVARSTDSKAQISLVDNSTTSVGSVVVGAEGDNLFLTSGSGGSEAMRIDSSGRVGIGKSDPSAGRLVVTSSSNGGFGGSLVLENSNASDTDKVGIAFRPNGSATTAIGSYGESRIISEYNSGSTNGANHLQFHTHAGDGTVAERMRIDSSGRVGIGTTSPDYLFNVVSGNNDMCRFQQTTNNQGDDYACLNFKHAAAQGSSTACIVLFQNSGGTTVGTIKMNAGATAYNTSSDYRLKENVTAISDGITRLKTLKPSRFNFKVDKDTTVDGFLAHEVTAVPEAITGTKDEVDSDNNPIYQGIDQSKLVPLLTAALQEAVAKIEVLETKVAALEAG